MHAPYLLDILMQKKRQLQSVELIQEFSATQKELISYAQALSLLLISKIDNLGEY